MEMKVLLGIIVLALLLTLVVMLLGIRALSKQIQQIKLDMELDRSAHEHWVNEILLLSSRLRTFGEESAAWATLVENHFAYLDDIEYKRRVRKELPKPLTPFSLRKQESEQPELSKDG